MAEDLETLTAKLTNISGRVENIAGDVSELKRLIEEANQNPAVDLTEALALATSIEERVTSIDDSHPGTPPAEPPVE